MMYVTALLLHCAGQKVQDIYYTLPDREPAEGQRAYDKATEVLTTHFRGKVSIPYERYCFRGMTQMDKSVEQYVIRLKQQAKLCDFVNEDEQIRDQVIEKCKSHKHRTSLLERGRDLTFDQFKTIAQDLESSENHAKSMENPSGPFKTASKTVNVVSNSKTT